MSLIDIKSLDLNELTDFVTENGFEKFRAKQIYQWLNKNVTSFDEMLNIPLKIKDFLKRSCYISVANIEKKLISRYDKTVKYLFSFNDGECVAFPHKLAAKWAVLFVQPAKAVFRGV